MEQSALKPWSDAMPRLVAVAAGREKADLVIRGGHVVNVHTREVLEGWEVAVADGRFAYVGPDAAHCIGPATEVIDATGHFLVPGLCDGHMHIESGMLTPAEFARAVIPHGTTTMFHDPHEIANVLGLRGVRLMHDEALMQPVNIFTQMPSCAPSAPGLETTGYEIGPDDVAEAMTWPGIIGLGEMMNFPGVVHGDPQMLAEMAATMRAGKTVGGHYASPDLGPAFHAYVAGGASDDHEGTREEDAIARARQGMRSMLRLGSAWYDVEAQITAVTQRGLDPRNFILCTDDCHSGTLVHEGHMNRVVRHAIACGCDPLVALQMATVNTASHFGLERELGSIAPGRRADVILTTDLATLPIHRVIARGVTVAIDGRDHRGLPAPRLARGHARDREHRPTLDGPRFRGPGARRRQYRHRQGHRRRREPGADKGADRPASVSAASSKARARSARSRCRAPQGHGQGRERLRLGLRLQGPHGHRLDRRARQPPHDRRGHRPRDDGRRREPAGGGRRRRHRLEGRGRDRARRAARRGPHVRQPGGRGRGQGARMVAAMAECGCTLNNAYMQHSLLALVVIPELRISDLGLVDVTRFQLTPLFEETT
jgi:adenine deaminase